MTRTDNWTANWACNTLLKHDSVVEARVLEGNLLELDAKGIPRSVEIATMSVDKVNATEIKDVCVSSSVEFVLNINAGAFYDKTAIQFSEQQPVGIGSVGDLYRAINDREFRNYLPKETRFILRGLRQHTNVANVTRLNNRTYWIERHKHSSLSVLALNDYDLTAESVRDGMERFGQPSIILTSNPNCRASTESIQATAHSEVRVLSWRELLGALNRA